MRTHTRILGALATIAMLAAFSGAARAEFSMSKGRTRAIREGIARHINAHPVAHVNYDIGQRKVTRTVSASEIRFRSKPLPSKVSVVGAAERAVTWRLASGVLRGTAQSTTPVLPKGGQLTRVSDVKYRFMPKGLPPVMAQQNARWGLRSGIR